MKGIAQREFVFKRIDENTRQCSGIVYDLHRHDWKVSTKNLEYFCKSIFRELESRIVERTCYNAFSFDFYAEDLKDKKVLDMISGFGFSTEILINSLEWALHNTYKNRDKKGKLYVELRILVAGY